MEGIVYFELSLEKIFSFSGAYDDGKAVE